MTKHEAEQYRLLQAEEMLLRFERAIGHPAGDVDELATWVETAGIERPVEPSDEARGRYRNGTRGDR